MKKTCGTKELNARLEREPGLQVGWAACSRTLEEEGYNGSQGQQRRRRLDKIEDERWIHGKPLGSNMERSFVGQTERDLERAGLRKQRAKPRYMASYLPVLVASPAWSGYLLNITSQLKPTEGLHSKMGVGSRRSVPFGGAALGASQVRSLPI